MSESGHSQPGMYGQGRRRRRRRGDRDVGPPGQNLSGPSRDRDYQPRERRVLQTIYCFGLWFYLLYIKILTRIIFFPGWKRGSTRSSNSEDPHHSCKTSRRKGRWACLWDHKQFKFVRYHFAYPNRIGRIAKIKEYSQCQNKTSRACLCLRSTSISNSCCCLYILRLSPHKIHLSVEHQSLRSPSC